MTTTEIKEFVDARAKDIVSDSSYKVRGSLQQKYIAINDDFMKTLGADTRITEMAQLEIEKIWGAFCAGFVCGQDKPDVGRQPDIAQFAMGIFGGGGN